MKSRIRGEVTNVIRHDSSAVVCRVHGEIDTPELPALPNQNVYLKIYGKNINVRSGDFITAFGKIRLPREPSLPTDFPEASYFRGQNLQWIASASKQNVSWHENINPFLLFRENTTNLLKKQSARLFKLGQDKIVNAILLGDKTGLSPELRRVYSLSGTAHVLAQSGLHVGIIAYILFLFLNFTRNRTLKFALYVILLFLFVFLTGFGASAVRAAAMAVLIFGARVLQRRYSPLNILCVVALFAVLIEPSMLFSAGFQMSVASIVGIILLYYPIKKTFQKLFPKQNKASEYLFSSVALTFAASATVSPIVAVYFGTYSVVSFLTNLFIIPLFSLALIFSIIAIALSFIYLPFAMLYADLTSFLLLLSESINKFSVTLPHAFFDGTTAILLSFVVLLAIAYVAFAQNRRQIIFRLAVSFAAIILILQINIMPENLQVKIYPRDNFTMTTIEKNGKIRYVYLADRKPSIYPKIDFFANEYLKQIPDSFCLLVNGNAGMKTASALKQSKFFHYIELPVDFQATLDSAIFGKKKASQIIEINE